MGSRGAAGPMGEATKGGGGRERSRQQANYAPRGRCSCCWLNEGRGAQAHNRDQLPFPGVWRSGSIFISRSPCTTTDRPGLPCPALLPVS